MNLYTYIHRYICIYIYIYIIDTVPIFTIFSHFLLRLPKKYPPIALFRAAEMKQLKMARLSEVPVAGKRLSWSSWSFPQHAENHVVLVRNLLGSDQVMSEN